MYRIERVREYDVRAVETHLDSLSGELSTTM